MAGFMYAGGVSGQDAADVVDRFWAALSEADSATVGSILVEDPQLFEYDRALDEFSRMEWAGFPYEYFTLTWGFPDVEFEVHTLQEVRSGSFITRRERRVGPWGEDVAQATYLVRDGRIVSIWSYPSEPDSTSDVRITDPSFTANSGPIIGVDAIHNNMHKPDGSLSDLVALARADGFRVRAVLERFQGAVLDSLDILVVGNPRSRDGRSSAFTSTEVDEVVRWIQGGGSLLLISDHPPYAEGSAQLAEALGFEPFIGVAVETPRSLPDIFVGSNGSLADHYITRGDVDTVATMTGHAFRIRSNARPLLTLVGSWEGRPTDPNAPVVPLAGWHQGAAGELGAGRFVFMAEARSFVALGLRDAAAFALRTLRWLARVPEA